ncbi:MAG: hypothetical protein ACYCQJ_13780 [Nitrososphaerales archaeon]
MRIKCQDGEFILNPEQTKILQRCSKQLTQLAVYEFEELELPISKDTLQCFVENFPLTLMSYEGLCSLANDYDYFDMEDHLEQVLSEILLRLKSYPLAERVALLQ